MECVNCEKEFKETNYFILGLGIELVYCSDKCLKTYYED